MKYPGLVGFALGGAVGGLSVYIFLKKRFENELQKEIEDVKEVYSKPSEKIDVKTVRLDMGDVYSAVDSFKEYVGSSTIEHPTYIEEKITEEEKIREGKELGMLHPEEDPDIPYLISDDTYVDTKPNYTKEILHFYAGDEVIADEDLEAIIHPEAIVGDMIPEYFDNLLRTEHYADAIYIRNDNQSRDFEILYHEDKFFCD